MGEKEREGGGGGVRKLRGVEIVAEGKKEKGCFFFA